MPALGEDGRRRAGLIEGATASSSISACFGVCRQRLRLTCETHSAVWKAVLSCFMTVRKRSACLSSERSSAALATLQRSRAAPRTGYRDAAGRATSWQGKR